MRPIRGGYLSFYNRKGLRGISFFVMAGDGDQDPQRDRPEGDPVGRISADDTVAPSL